MKKGSSFLITIFSIIIAILLLFHLFLNSSIASTFISSKVSSYFAGSIDWQKHKISFLKGRVYLQDFKISDSNGNRVISAESLAVRISILGLRKGNVQILKGTAYKPIVDLKIEQSGMLNIVSLFQSNKKEKPPKKENNAPLIELSKINISDGYFSYYDSLNNWNLAINNIFIDGDYNISKTIADVKLKTGNINYSKKDTLSFDSLNLAGKIYGADIDSLFIQLFKKDDQLNLSGSFNNIYNFKKTSASYNLNTKILTANYPLIFNGKWPIKGNVKLSLDQIGTFNNPNVDITLDIENQNKKVPIDYLSTKASLNKKLLNISSLKVLLGNSFETNTKGVINLGKVFPFGFANDSIIINNVEYSIRSSLELKNKSNIISSSIANKMKKIKGELNISGSGVTLDSIKLDGTINASSEFRPIDKIEDNLFLESKLSLFNEAISFDSKLKSKYAGEGKINGKYNLGNKSINVDISNLMFDSELLNNFSKIPFMGIYTLNGTVEGFLDSLIADVYLNGESVKVDSVNIEKVVTVISVNNKDGIVSGRLQAKSDIGFGEFSFNSKCFKNKTFELIKEPEIQSRISIDLNEVSPIIKNGISGDLKIQGKFSGYYNNGEGDILISSELLKHEFIYAKKLNTYISFDGKSLTIDSLTAKLPGGYINALGSVNNFKTFSLKTRGNVVLDSLQKVKEYNTAGNLNFDFSSEGDFKTPIAKLKISVDNPVIVNQEVDSLVLDANLVAGAIDFNVYSDFKCYGYYKIDKQEYSIHASLDSTNFMTFILPKGQGLWRGNVSGYSYLKGIGSSIDSMMLDLYDFSVDYDTVNLARSEALNIYYNGDSIHVKNTNINLIDDGFVQFSGGFSSLGRGDLNGLFSIPYSTVEFFTDDFQEGEGLLEGNVSVFGDIKKPTVIGEFKTESASFLYTNTSQRFTNINLTGKFSDTSISIIQSSMNMESGSLNFKGYLASGKRKLDSLNIRMKCTFKEIPLDLPEVGEFLLSGDVDIISNPKEGLASGDIKLLNGIYYKDLDLNLFNREKKVKKRVTKESESSFFDKIKMDIQLLPYNPVTIDNNIAYLNVVPQVKLKGSISKPIVSGRAKVNDGFITFRNREFEIKRGFLDFIDPYSNNPDVDIAAEVKVDKWVVTIEIEGNTNEKLNFRLLSNPSLSDREILSLLLIGKPEITGLEDAISVAGDFAGEYLGRTVDKVSTVFSLPIDKVSVSSKDISDGLTVNIEQDVSKYLSTVYSINMKNGDVTRKAELLLKIFDNFSAKGFTETNEKRGFELEAGFEKQ